MPDQIFVRSVNLAIGFIFIAIGCGFFYSKSKQSQTRLTDILPGTCFSAFGMVAIGVALWTPFTKSLPDPKVPPPEPQEVVVTFSDPLLVRWENFLGTYAAVESADVYSSIENAPRLGHSPIVRLEPPETFAPAGLSPIPGRER